MHARVRRLKLSMMIGTRLTLEEKTRVELVAQDHGLTPSQYVRKVVLESFEISASQRMILAEVCATRRELESLLQAISDLDPSDVERARREADHIREALVGQRVQERNLSQEMA